MSVCKDLMEQRIVGLERLIEDNAERHLTDLSQHKTLTERLFDTELVNHSVKSIAGSACATYMSARHLIHRRY